MTSFTPLIEFDESVHNQDYQDKLATKHREHWQQTFTRSGAQNPTRCPILQSENHKW